ncbi:MAG TPA: pseudouridine synthase, partial [Polyangiaceae bacterium]|nr:pseudouridine synthase [Polyangiaceae bacterium]
MPEERLQKVLARAGVASRRAAEALITAGRVRVDGRIVSELGVRVGTRARVEVDGRLVVAEPLVYIVLHKPRGVVCTLKDPEGRPTVAEYLKDVGARVVPVGRLDFHTSGALICTNDGELASHLMHPRHHAKKEYVAKVSGVVDEKALERLRERIVIDGRATQPAEVNLLRVEDGKSWLSVKLGEGRNRQVRRLGEHAGMPVMRLARVAHAGITAEGLRPGEWRRLTLDELRTMKQEYGVPRRIHAADPLADARGGRVTLRKPRAPAGRGRELNDRPRPPREAAHGRDFGGERRPSRDGGHTRDFGAERRPSRDAQHGRDFGAERRPSRDTAHGRDFGGERLPSRDGGHTRDFGGERRPARNPAHGRDFGGERRPARNPAHGTAHGRDFGGERRPSRDGAHGRDFGGERRPSRNTAHGRDVGGERR